MAEITLQNIKDLLRAEFKIQFKKELGPIKKQLNDMSAKLDFTSNLVVNLSEDLKDVPDKIEEILGNQRHTGTHIDWLATAQKNRKTVTK